MQVATSGIPPRRSTIEPKELAAAAAWIADQKKGQNIRIFEVTEHIQVADYFVFVTGTSRPHVKALYEETHARLKALGQTHSKAEGMQDAWWVLIDYLDVVVHLLQPEAREYYDLDRLYGECPELDWKSIELPLQVRSDIA
jgi:ribosome-associated protein